MDNYAKQQKLMDNVCGDIEAFHTLVAPKDESKKDKFGFIPGMNNMQNEEKLIGEYVHTLREGIFQVLFTGGFSAGKSTLLNALMRKDILKMSIKAETAVITKIIFNADEKVIVYKKNVDEKGQPVQETYTIDEFFKVYSVDQENPTKFKDVNYVQLQQSQDGIGGSLVQLVDSPGTSNSDTDTEMSREFAEHASAIVYMINATQPFTDEDKKYIASHYAHKELKNVFFIINRYDSINPGSEEALKDSTYQQLKNVFTINGQFNQELYNKRVFFTNAYGSLNTRVGKLTKTPYGDFMIEDHTTGVPDFEQAMNEFLTDDDRDKSALAAYVPKLSNVYSIAKRKSAEELKTYEAGKLDLERKRDELNNSIEKVDRILSGVRSSCKNIAADMVRDIKRDYESYVDAIDRDWDSHFSDPNVLKDIDFSTISLIKVAATKDMKKREAITKPIQDAVKKYIYGKQPILVDSMNQSIDANIEKLKISLSNYQQQLEDLNCPIDIKEILSHISNLLTNAKTEDVDVTINGFQVILGLVFGDLDIAMGGVNGNNSNTQAIVKSLVTNVTEYIAVYVVAWPLGLAMLCGRVFHMIKGVKNSGAVGKEKILSGLKDSTINDLRNAKTEVAVKAENKAAGSIIRAGETFSKSFKSELLGYKESYEDMIKNLDNENFNIKYEKDRLQKILNKMVELVSEISLLTTGNSLSESDVLKKADINIM